MSKSGTNIPKRRFPEFRGKPEWEEKKLIDVADKKVKWSFIGGPFGSNLKSTDYTSTGPRIIQLQNIGDGEFLDEYKIYTSTKKADELLANNIYAGDIILSKMGDPVARACIIPDIENRYVMCSDGIRLVVDEKLFDKLFVFTSINSKHFRNLAEKASTGSTRKRIGLSDLKNLPLFTPKIDEQKKIADCLTSIDNLILSSSKKVEALKEHKKGLMQQLFPKEGETVPKLRFSEFKGKWEKTTLGNLCKYWNGNSHEKSVVESGKYHLISLNSIDIEGRLKQDMKRINDTDNSLQKNDLVMVLSDVAYGNFLGLTEIIPNDNYVLNQRMGGLRVKKSKLVNVEFLRTYINYNQKYFKGQGQGSSQLNLSKSSVLDFCIYLPSLQEQKSLANCLSLIDNLIDKQTQKVKALKEHKKGLMQQLFPNSETDK
jgi:type I restriction enzyme, S subunit